MCCTATPESCSWPIYLKTKRELAVCDNEESPGKNQLASTQQLCCTYAFALSVFFFHLPPGMPLVTFRTSERFPPESFRSTRLSPNPFALKVPVPVSLSEPRIETTLPSSLTSLTATPPVRASMACCASVTAS